MSRKVFNIRETSFDSSVPDLRAPGSESDGAAKPIGLVLAGQHPLTLYGLSQVFGKEADCTVLSVCTDSEGTLDAVRRLHPDVLILDLDRHAAFKVLRRIQREHLSTRVVVLATASEDTEMLEAVQLGARAVMLKELPPEAFVACVRKVHAEAHSLQTHNASRSTSRLSRAGTSRHGARILTPRETEIARLAVLGISTRDIAARLLVKQGTVKIHLHSIYEKLNVGGRLGLVLFARRYGLT
jgi:DNA-binding NarL/FixJ family response regulator